MEYVTLRKLQGMSGVSHLQASSFSSLYHVMLAFVRSTLDGHKRAWFSRPRISLASQIFSLTLQWIWTSVFPKRKVHSIVGLLVIKEPLWFKGWIWKIKQWKSKQIKDNMKNWFSRWSLALRHHLPFAALFSIMFFIGSFMFCLLHCNLTINCLTTVLAEELGAIAHAQKFSHRLALLLPF